MSTFLLVGTVFIVLLIVLSHIPGVEHLVKPLLSGVTSVFSTFMGGVGGWLLWGIKTAWRSRTVSASCVGFRLAGGLRGQGLLSGSRPRNGFRTRSKGFGFGAASI